MGRGEGMAVVGGGGWEVGGEVVEGMRHWCVGNPSPWSLDTLRALGRLASSRQHHYTHHHHHDHHHHDPTTTTTPPPPPPTMQAWHKEQKAKAIKKGKASTLKDRTEKLSKRNPERLQRQIDDLSTAISAGATSAHNKKTLAELERDLAAVKRARKAVGIEDKEETATRKRPREEVVGAAAGEGPSGEGDWRRRRREMRLGAAEGEAGESDSGEYSARGGGRWGADGCRREYVFFGRGYPDAAGPAAAAAGSGDGAKGGGQDYV